MWRQYICSAFPSESDLCFMDLKERYSEANEDSNDDWGVVDNDNPS